MKRTSILPLSVGLVFSVGLLAQGCGDSGSSGGTGGTTGAGGTMGTGGAMGAGGEMGTGGAIGTGGEIIGMGGAVASGGSGPNGSGGVGGATTTGVDAGPSFKEYTPQGLTFSVDNVSAANGVIESSTYFSYVENAGSAGTATVTINNQGYTETLQVLVEAGTQYVLGTKLTMTNFGQNSTVTSCLLSSQLPGLTLSENLGSAPSSSSVGGTCAKVSGTSSSFLIPLSSCSCTGGFAVVTARFTNCGVADPNCCDACPSGKSCNNGMCG
jgi:hypothetical protein